MNYLPTLKNNSKKLQTTIFSNQISAKKIPGSCLYNYLEYE